MKVTPDEIVALGSRENESGRHPSLTCPVCHSWMIRVHRRPLDRLLNAGIPTQRFRCQTPTCAYECLSKPQTLEAKARPWIVAGLLTALAIVWASYLAFEFQTIRAEVGELDRSLVGYTTHQPIDHQG